MASSLEMTVSVPGFSSSPSLASSRGAFDINQVPSGEYGEDSSNCDPPRRKFRLSKEQYRLLEESFRDNHTLNPKQKETLAMHLKLKPRQVKVWFQNRTARSKLKQTELKCKYLKRWFGSLSEQKRRLKREVEELRAIKWARRPP